MNELDKLFEVPMIEIDRPAEPSLTMNPVVIEDGVEEDEDFKFTRGNQYELIEISRAGVQTAMKVLAETENHHAVTALSSMLKTASDLNRQLVQMSKDRVDVKQAKKNAGQAAPQQIGQQNNNTYVITGTMKDVLASIREKKKNEEIK